MNVHVLCILELKTSKKILSVSLSVYMFRSKKKLVGVFYV